MAWGKAGETVAGWGRMTRPTISYLFTFPLTEFSRYSCPPQKTHGNLTFPFHPLILCLFLIRYEDEIQKRTDMENEFVIIKKVREHPYPHQTQKAGA